MDMREALSMDDRMRQFGMDPDAKRNMLLPLPTDARTEADPRKWNMSDWTAPEWLYEGARALNLPGHVARGGDYEAKDVTDMGLALMGMGTTGAATGGVPRGALGMNVFQGGPHKYGPEGAAKSLEHIGKGEGAQAYGWGRYDAGAESVGEQYQSALRKVDTAEFDVAGIPPSKWNAANMFAKQTDPSLPEVAARDYAVWVGDEVTPELVETFRKAMKPGYLYKHDLPDEDIARYLDWDKPLSEQPENVRSALSQLGVEAPSGKSIDQMNGEYLQRMLVGNSADVAGVSGANQAASEALGKAGIPGLKYLDGMSRGADEGTRNYVTWDQDVLDRMKLLERNGEDMREALLPMDEASRMARAREMGFDTDTPLYHGTQADFNQFEAGRNKAGGERGTFFSDNPEIGSLYAGYDPMWAPDIEGARVIPAYAKTDNMLEIEFGGAKQGRADAIRKAQSGGYDGVILKNHYDAGGVQDQYVIFDPKNIRSRFAKFDPSKKDSADLLAMGGSPIAAAPLAVERKQKPTITPEMTRSLMYGQGGL